MHLLNKLYFFILILIFTITPIFAQKIGRDRMQLNYIERPDMNYMRALLEINVNNKEDFLALDLILNNMLNREFMNKNNELLKNLAIMGNDYNYKCIPGGFLIEMKFLPEHIKYFGKFLNRFYNYKNFNRLTFLTLVANYWDYFYKKDWQLSLSRQLLFGSIFFPNKIKYINSSKDLLSFKYKKMLAAYKRIVTPCNSKIYFIGSLNPYNLCNSVRSLLEVCGNNSTKNRVPLAGNHHKKDFVFKGKKILDNQIFIFKSFVIKNRSDYIMARFFNSMALSYPYGKIYKLRQKWRGISIIGEEYNLGDMATLAIRIKNIPAQNIKAVIKEVKIIFNSYRAIDTEQKFLQQQLRFMIESLKINSAKNEMTFNTLRNPLVFNKTDRSLFFSLNIQTEKDIGINIKDTSRRYIQVEKSLFKNAKTFMVIFSNDLKIKKDDHSTVVINLDKI